jgi:hypothetical protein
VEPTSDDRAAIRALLLTRSIDDHDLEAGILALLVQARSAECARIRALLTTERQQWAKAARTATPAQRPAVRLVAQMLGRIQKAI